MGQLGNHRPQSGSLQRIQIKRIAIFQAALRNGRNGIKHLAYVKNCKNRSHDWNWVRDGGLRSPVENLDKKNTKVKERPNSDKVDFTRLFMTAMFYIYIFNFISIFIIRIPFLYLQIMKYHSFINFKLIINFFHDFFMIFLFLLKNQYHCNSIY